MERELPTELYLQIFQDLTQEEIRKSASLACRKWYNIVQDYHLVDHIVHLRSPCDHYKRLLNDFKKYPTFGVKVKTMNVKDYVTDDSEHSDHGADEFISLLELCHNLEELKISMSCSTFFSNILEKIFSGDRQIKSNLKLMDLEFDCFYKPKTIEIDIIKLINYTLPSLHQLVIDSSLDILSLNGLTFVNSGLFLNNTCKIQKIKILCLYSMMTKACLEYLISGSLTNLEELHLSITLVGSESSIIEETATVWEKLRKFCLNSLKKYDITIFNKDSSFSFSVYNVRQGDNEEIEEEEEEDIEDETGEDDRASEDDEMGDEEEEDEEEEDEVGENNVVFRQIDN